MNPDLNLGVNILRCVVVVLAMLMVSGCVTETKNASGGTVRPGKVDRQEASRINTQLGIEYMRQQQNDLALQKLTRAIDQDARNADAHSALAILYTRTGDNENAERHYRKALLLSPNDPSIKNSFGAWLCSRGKPAESLNYFLEAAKSPRYRTPAAAYSNAGACAMKLNRYSEAEQYFRQALSIDSNFADALAQMAILNYRQGNFLKTRAFLQRYESSGKESADMLVLGLRTEEKLGDQRAAASYQSRLQRDYPEVAERLGQSPSTSQK